MIYDLIIVGGGSSGVVAGITYKKCNPKKNILIIESNNTLLKKLACSGNGKCNFTNANLSYDKYNNGESFKYLFNDKSLNKILSFFEEHKIIYYKDEEGRYYPYSNSAKSVQYALINDLDEKEYLLETKVKSITYDGIFTLNTFNKERGEENYNSKKLVIAVGSKNYKSLGSDGELFNEITKLGHSFTPIYPSDIYIKIKEKNITKLLNGLRFKANLALYNDDKFIYQEKGELLFKEDALSGIVTFNISSKLANIYKNNEVKNPYMYIDYISDLDYKELLDKYNKSNNKKAFLLGIIHPEMVKIIENENNPIEKLKRFKFNITSLGDFDHAQIACGGIKSNEIQDLESNIIKGLYFIGDILDIDAPCGGYNLSFAFLSGMKVGEEIE